MPVLSGFSTLAMREDYLSSNPDTKVTNQEFADIVHGFYEFIMEKVFDGYDVYLPMNMGMVAARGKKSAPIVLDTGKISGIPPDWPATKELWKFNPIARAKKQIVYNFNEHTHGVVYNLHWYRNSVEIPNKTIYNFIFSRRNKRRFAALIKEGREYPEYHKPQERKDYVHKQNLKDEVTIIEEELW